MSKLKKLFRTAVFFTTVFTATQAAVVAQAIEFDNLEDAMKSVLKK